MAVTEKEEWKEGEQRSSGEGQWERWGIVNLVLDRVSLQYLLNLKENAPSKQVGLGMELKTEKRFGSH